MDEIQQAVAYMRLTKTITTKWAKQASADQLEFFHGYLQEEVASRQANRRKRLLAAAHLPVIKSLQNYDWSTTTLPNDITRNHLTNLDFLHHREDLVLSGDVGTGKTHLASALVAQACSQGIPARFTTAQNLTMTLRTAKQEGGLQKELTKPKKLGLLVIDELGYLPIDSEGARLLFQVITGAYEHQSMIITTNLEFSKWGTIFGDDNLAAAVIDRLVHHGRLIRFQGDSWRITHALMK